MNGDSMELLLDTVCSMFGAITLIAILVGLLANTGSSDSPTKHAGAEMTRRRIATAEADLSDTEALKKRLPKPDGSRIATSVIEKRRMEDALKEARIDEVRAAGDLQDSANEQGANLDREWKKLEEDRKAMERRMVEESEAIHAQEENAQRLQSRIKAVVGQIEREKESRVVKLRFPREREKTKQPYPIICKFGRIYPVHDASAQENTKMIKWVNEDRGRVSLPIESEGWSAEKDEPAMDEMLRGISSKDFYVIFIVFPDSFDAYHDLRDRVTAAKVDFGLSIEPSEAHIYWGEDGHIPPPL